MTFCVGMRLKEGIIGLADNLIITGNEAIRAKKVTTHRAGDNSFFLMTSGLRSARDKTITYLDEALEHSQESLDRLYKAVNIFSRELRRVKKEDGEALSESGFTFNIYSIIGGQFENDPEPQLFLVYPQGTGSTWDHLSLRYNRRVEIRKTDNKKNPYLRHQPRYGASHRIPRV